MHRIILVIILIAGLLSVSCDETGEVNHTKSISPIIETELPQSGNVGQEINFIVHHAVFNGCGYYSSQETIKIGNTIRVAFYAEYREGFCTMDIPIRKTNYKFTPTVAGTYTFIFNSGDAGYLTQTIIIE
jgi:hypothetical protein